MRIVVQFEYMFSRLGWLARNRDLLAPGDLLNCMSEKRETLMYFVYQDPAKEGSESTMCLTPTTLIRGH